MTAVHIPPAAERLADLQEAVRAVVQARARGAEAAELAGVLDQLAEVYDGQVCYEEGRADA